VLDPSFLNAINTSLIPVSDNVYTLGSSTLRWSDVRTALLNGWNPDAHASRHADGGADEITGKLDYRAMNIIQAKAIRTTTFSTTSTSYVDIMSVSVTLPAASNVLIFSQVFRTYNNLAFAANFQQLVEDATPLREIALGNSLNDSHITHNSLIQHLRVGATAGTKTYKLQGRVPSGSTGYWEMYTSPSHGEICVIAFPS